MTSTTSEVHAELERILASRWLRESHQLSALLRHIVEATLAGETDRLKEYSLGREVFHRPPDYDPRSDAIVRVQASGLRKRLASYYEHEGTDSPLRIVLPRGTYVPQFENSPPSRDPGPDPAEPPRSPRWPVFAAGLLAGALLVTGFSYFRQRPPGLPPVECPELWGAYLNPEVETVASFGVPLFFAGDGGLFVRDTQVNRLSDDQSRVDRVGGILGKRLRAQGDVYTGIGDAIGTHQVARWLEQRGVKTSMANSNYIGTSDIERRNLVIVASARFQTILQSMDLPHRLHFLGDGTAGGFSLDHPLPGEQAVYSPRNSDTGVSTSYAVISLWPGLSSGRRILYLSGIETWCTQAAALYAVDPAQMRDLHRKLTRDPADGPRGRKSPYFQVLLRVEGKNNVVRSTQYVTHRYLPAS